MILYFSGTGNSADIASRLGRLTGDRAMRMEPGLKRVEIEDGERRVVWVFPVHSWGVPPFVLSAIRRITFLGHGVVHHMVATCGDDCGMTDRQWRRAMAAKGYRAGGAFTVIMPNSYVAMPGFDVDPAPLRDSKIAASDARVREIATLLPGIEKAAEPYTDVVRGAFPRLKTSVIYPWFVRFAINARKFRVDESCIGCGRCAKACPVGNITLDGSRPVWGADCTGCLACYHTCPMHAIAYGSSTRGKGQYLRRQVR